MQTPDIHSGSPLPFGISPRGVKGFPLGIEVLRDCTCAAGGTQILPKIQNQMAGRSGTTLGERVAKETYTSLIETYRQQCT